MSATEKQPVKVRTWRCRDCGYIHEGAAPPGFCPECYAPSDAFVEVTGE